MQQKNLTKAGRHWGCLALARDDDAPASETDKGKKNLNKQKLQQQNLTRAERHWGCPTLVKNDDASASKLTKGKNKIKKRKDRV